MSLKTSKTFQNQICVLIKGSFSDHTCERNVTTKCKIFVNVT